MNFNRFENKVVLVVGAGAGMGEATALQFAREGANVIALDIFEDRLERLAGKSDGLSGRIIPFLGDISDAITVDGVIDSIRNEHGTLDILAYVAGIMDFMTPPELVDEALWDRVMDINVKSVWRIVKSAIPLMKGHVDDTASVVIVSSLGGLVGSSAGTAYITSKHAVEGLMKSLAFSLKAEQIRVNSIAPGAFATEIMQTSARLFPEKNFAYGMCPEGMELYMKSGICALNPRTNVGAPQYIADSITFLASQEARFINGVTLVVDGGWSSL